MISPVTKLSQIINATKGTTIIRDWIIRKVALTEHFEKKAINDAYEAGYNDAKMNKPRHNYYNSIYRYDSTTTIKANDFDQQHEQW